MQRNVGDVHESALYIRTMIVNAIRELSHATVLLLIVLVKTTCHCMRGGKPTTILFANRSIVIRAI